MLTSNQKQVMKSKKAEANARRKVNKSWENVEHTPRYRSASAKEVCDTITKKIEIEVLDGILLNLSIKSQTKPSSVQNRILRRICREASGTGKPQEAWAHRRPLLNTRFHYQHKSLHGSHTQEKVCRIAKKRTLYWFQIER